MQLKVGYRTAMEWKRASRMQKVGLVLWVGAPTVLNFQG